MAQFKAAFQITMNNEGGYANNPADRGGETYKGIAKNYWPSWVGWSIVDGVLATQPTCVNSTLAANGALQSLVSSFYKINFWNTEMLDSLNDQQTANQLFDIAVNMGPDVASRLLQEGINMLAPNTLTVDGQVGPLTISAANNCNAEALYNAICRLRKNRYEAIIRANPSQAPFANSRYSRIKPYQIQV